MQGRGTPTNCTVGRGALTPPPDNHRAPCSASVGGGVLDAPPHRAPCHASVGATLAVAHGRGNRRSAAGGGRSEAISRKCPDWRPRQWPGIGWHDGGQESPAPTNRPTPHPLPKAMSLRGYPAPVAIRIPLHRTPCYASGGVLSANSGRKYPKNAALTKVLKSFARCLCGKSSAKRTKRSSLPPCFRIDSAPPSAGRSRGPALPWRGRDALFIYRATRCGHRALRKFGGHTSVGADAHIGPPGLVPHSLQNPCHCEASAHTGFAIRLL